MISIFIKAKGFVLSYLISQQYLTGLATLPPSLYHFAVHFAVLLTPVLQLALWVVQRNLISVSLLPLSPCPQWE